MLFRSTGRVVHDVLPAEGEDVADAQAGHAGEERCRLQYGLLARRFGQFVELFHRKIIFDYVLGLDLFEEVVDVVADQSVTVEDFQKSPECRPISRCGVSCDVSVTLEFLCRQQVLTELVAEINVELLKSTFPMHEVAEMEIWR